MQEIGTVSISKFVFSWGVGFRVWSFEFRAGDSRCMG